MWSSIAVEKTGTVSGRQGRRNRFLGCFLLDVFIYMYRDIFSSSFNLLLNWQQLFLHVCKKADASELLMFIPAVFKTLSSPSSRI